MSRSPPSESDDLSRQVAEMLHLVLVPALLESARATPPPSLSEEDLQDVAEQAGASWLLSCAAIRMLEAQGAAHGLFPPLERQHAEGPAEALRSLFHLLARTPGPAALFGAPYNALWRLPLPDAAAQQLIDIFWGPDLAEHPSWRGQEASALLERLYQDLSLAPRHAHATLSTPSFVVDFILERTLRPAVATFGLRAVRLLDPVCGSGSFLVRAFARLCALYQQAEPGGSIREQALTALAQVSGVDIAPLAVLVTRLRLTLAFLEHAGVSRLESVPHLPLHIVAADSLLGGAPGEARSAEECDAASRIMGHAYHVVVGNPPYAEVPDMARRHLYQARYASARRHFSLSAPFIERFFQLTLPGGFVGLISSNSFMYRESGEALVERVLPRIELTHVLDTSGASLPGYGTPTLILLGRNQPPAASTIRAVVGKRGEPTKPWDPAKGRVWLAMTRHLDEPGYEDDFIQVADLPRARLERHPWPLATGLEAEVLQRLEQQSMPLAECFVWMGTGSWPGTSALFELPPYLADRLGLEKEAIRPFIHGESIRNWAAPAHVAALVPYHPETQTPLENSSAAWMRYLWPYRPVLAARPLSRYEPSQQRNDWWQWSVWRERPGRSTLCLFSPTISSHNQFANGNGDKLASSSVLILELRADWTEDDLLVLLAYLNSSIACCWMSHHLPSLKGALRFSEGILSRMPVPKSLLQPGGLREQVLVLARRLEQAARGREACSPRHVLDNWSGGARDSLLRALAHAQQQEFTLLRQMVCDQEDLDWALYGALGLAGEAAARGTPGFALPEHRPFQWLSEAPPKRLSPSLAEAWGLRRQELKQNRLLTLLETTPYKRPWHISSGPVRGDYRQQVTSACEEWLLGRMEQFFQGSESPRAVSHTEVLSFLRGQAGTEAVASIHVSHGGPGLERLVAALLEHESAPYLAALRYTASGLKKRARWEAAWRRQSLEADSPPPLPTLPDYTPVDFQQRHLWRLRGRLDVPRERFILYLGVRSEPLYGWAGWDLVQRAQVLLALLTECKRQGLPEEQLPLLGGLLELLPGIERWYHAPDPRLGAQRPHEHLHQVIREEAQALDVSIGHIQAWRPPPGGS